MSKIIDLENTKFSTTPNSRESRSWNTYRRENKSLAEAVSDARAKYPAFPDSTTELGERTTWDTENYPKDPLSGEAWETNNSGFDWGGETNSNTTFDWNKNDNKKGGNDNMNNWGANNDFTTNNINNNWGLNSDSSADNSFGDRRDRRDRRGGYSSYDNAETDIKQDISELAKWSQATASNIKINDRLTEREKESIIRSFEKLSVRGLKKIAEVLDDEEYSALANILGALGFEQKFISATAGANPLSLDKRTLVKTFKELKDVIDSEGKAEDMSVMRFNRLTQRLVKGEAVKSDEVYEMINELIDNNVINPKRISTDPTKAHLIVTMNKADEWLLKKNPNASNDNAFGVATNAWGVDINATAATTESWGATPTFSSTTDYYDSSRRRRDRRDRRSSGSSDYSVDLTYDIDRSYNNYRGSSDPVLDSVRAQDRRESRDRRAQDADYGSWCI